MMIIRVLFVLSALFAATAYAGLVGGKKDDYTFHSGPVYRVPKLQKAGDNCQLRKYFNSIWVTTSPECLNANSSIPHGFMKLYFYMNRWNLGRKYYKLTQPSVTHYTKGDGEDCELMHQEMYYLPNDPEEEPPMAMDEKLTFVKHTVAKRYVSSYSADTMDFTACAKHYVKMLQELSEKRVRYSTDEYFCARYDPRDGDLNKLKFEVWVPAN